MSSSLKKSLEPYLWACQERLKGVKELLGRGITNARIAWYHAHTTLKATEDEVPWCSSFMCAAAESTGHQSTRSAAAKSWEKYGLKGTGAIGDIAVFKREGGHHVAFINKEYKEGDKLIEVLGGNQSNMVRISKYDAKNLLAIRKFPDTLS